VDRNRARELAVRGIVASQMSISLGIAQVVDGHDLNIVLFSVLVMGTQNIAADTAIPVNCDANRHCYSPVYKTCSTAAATCSTVKPKCLNKAPAGADSP